MLCTLLTATALFQQLPEGLPHPSHPVRNSVIRDLAIPGDHYLDETPFWVAISDSWWNEDCEVLDERRDFALSEGDRMGLTQDAAEAWYEAHAMGQVDLRFRISSEGKDLLSGMERVAVGRALDASDWTAESVVLDLDVEIASAAAIADPVMGVRFGGRSLAVKLLPVPGVGWIAECALVDTAPTKGGRIETGNHDIGSIPRLVSKLAEAEFSVLLRPGQSGTAQFPGPDGTPFEIELATVGGAAPAALEFARGTWLDAGAMAIDQQTWSRFLERYSDGNSTFHNGNGVMLLEGDGHAARADLMAEDIRSAIQPLDVEIRWMLEQDGAIISTQSATLSTPAGRDVRFASGTMTRVLEDWDVEVALGSRIPDPIFRDRFSGTRCVASAKPVGGGYMVDLDLTFNALSMTETRALLLGAQAPSRNSSEGEMPSSHIQQVNVDGVVSSTTAFRGTYKLGTDGKLTLERSAERLHGEGARLRVEIQVSGK